MYLDPQHWIQDYCAHYNPLFGVGPEDPMPAYQSLVWECWLPQVRLAVQRWQSRQPDSLIGQPSPAPLIPNSRAVDPDPHRSAFIFPHGSGSRRETYIKITSRKNAMKLVIIVIICKKTIVNLDQLHVF